ncbi:unnamed protein product [Vicia faba]|uniref:Uncharacterized protein n=1 Tax=Vicia faba TaxID=3906 RepID=A0AAV1AM23_VICFA|nr:unnamed protein product [Vicia faba]
MHRQIQPKIRYLSVLLVFAHLDTCFWIIRDVASVAMVHVMPWIRLLIGQLPITQEQYATLVNLLQQSNIQQGSSTATSNQVYSSTVTGNFLPEDDWFS